MSLKIGVIKGDGIGPEIVTEAMKVLDKAGEVYGFDCSYEQLLLGGASIDVHGVPLTDETVAKAKACDAVLMGSIGGDAKTSPWYKLEPSKRPEAGLLKIRKELNLKSRYRGRVLSRVGRRGRRGLGNGFLVCCVKSVQTVRTGSEIHLVSNTRELFVGTIER